MIMMFTLVAMFSMRPYDISIKKTYDHQKVQHTDSSKEVVYPVKPFEVRSKTKKCELHK